MGNFEQAGWEFTLGRSIYEQHVVLLCRARYDVRNGGILHFSAVQRGMFTDSALPAEVRDLFYEKPLGVQASFYSARLREQERHVLADMLDALGRRQLVGESADSSVWTAFWELVLANPDSGFVEALAHPWLADERTRALAQRAQRRGKPTARAQRVT